jgi:hypothetical protein
MRNRKILSTWAYIHALLNFHIIVPSEITINFSPGTGDQTQVLKHVKHALRCACGKEITNDLLGWELSSSSNAIREEIIK